jgi:anaerobic ribonucleoside-triphosphate reductase activating protein
LRVAGLIKNSVVNGIGIRDVLFLQGCKHHCIGCHNPKTWDEKGGTLHTIDNLMDKFKDSTNDITISGGEPLLQFHEDLYHFMKRVHREQGKRFWLYTGYRYEEIPNFVLIMLSEFTDVLVDGRFELDKKDLTLQFRGSSNQRLIDLPKSVKEEKIILWEDDRT